MSTYLVIEFPNLDEGISSYLLAKELFSSRCSCLGRSETNPIVSFMIFKNDVNLEIYEKYKQELPVTSKSIEVLI